MSLPRLRGHEEIRAHLARATVAGTAPQSMLLHGPEGVGKERLALWIAQLLVCESPDSTTGPCDRCHPCRLARKLEHPDVHWFFPLPRPDSGSPEKIRDKLEEHRAAELQLRRERADHVPSFDRAPAYFLAGVYTITQLASLKPSMGRKKVFVAGDAELMVPQEASPEAANAFLKLLEEPPADTSIVITSSQPGALLPTIRSRVLPIRVSPLSDVLVENYLVEELKIPEAQAQRIAMASRGAIGRAIRLVPSDGGRSAADVIRERGRSLLLAALSDSPTPRFVIANSQGPAGGRGEFTSELESLAEWVRDLIAVASGADERVADPDARKLLRRAVDQYAIHPLGAGRALDQVSTGLDLAQRNVNPQLILADLLGKMRSHLLPAGGAPPRPRPVRG